MANREEDFGMDVAITRKLNSKYDVDTEREAIGWLNTITGEQLPMGRENIQRSLRNGQLLLRLIEAVYSKTPNLPPRATLMKRPFKVNSSPAPFKQMENIQVFVDAAEAYGVPRESLFQTVDLYEARNMSQVLATIMQLGTECQRNGFQGPTCGPKPTYQQKRQWSADQLRSGEGIISLQAGTNKLASQKGMSIGAQRHIADLKCEQMTPEGAGILSLQMGTNKFASQKGMSIGSQRHIADIRCEEMCREGQAIINLQMGTNQCASQKGMRMGYSRHCGDIKCSEMSESGKGIINLQMGTNKLATQSGMRMGGQRFIADIKCDSVTPEGQGVIGLQMGSNKGANQSGMSFGSGPRLAHNNVQN